MYWKLAIRHLFRHWRLHLILFAIMLLGAAVLAILPMLAISIAGESLTETMATAPISERNIIIQGKTRSDEAPKEITAALGSLFKEIITVRNGDVFAAPIIYKWDGSEQNLHPQTIVLSMHSFDRLDERVNLIEGQLPDPEIRVEKDGLDILEAVIGLNAAKKMELKLGDEIGNIEESFRFRVVGIVEPIDPNSEIWWGDQQMIPFTAWRRIYTMPDIDEWNLSLIIPTQTMVSRGDYFQVWRVILNANQISVLSAPAVREILTGLQSRISDKGMILDTPLIDLITDFEENFALARITLLLLSIQSMIAVLYVMSMFGSFLVNSSKNELSTLMGRGYSRLNITGLFARSLSVLIILSGISAPLLARQALKFWAIWQETPIPSFIPDESWLLSSGAVFFSYLFLLISIFRSTNQEMFAGQGRGLIPMAGNKPGSQMMVLSLFLLIIGGLAYWQFSQGSQLIIKETAASLSDPILLLGPFGLFLAVALILIQLLPYLWLLLARISQRTRGFIWNWGFSRSARLPDGPGQITLLISLTAGFVFFTSAFNSSVESWQESMARLEVGAAVRLQTNQEGRPDAIDTSLFEGQAASTEVFRAKALIKVNDYQRVDFDLLAVDPETFANVSNYPPEISQFSIADIMNVIKPVGDGTLPIIIANTPNTRHLTLGDIITLELGEMEYPLQVVGVILNFPSTKSPFVVTDSTILKQVIDQDTIENFDQPSYEIWLDSEIEQLSTLIAVLESNSLESKIIANIIDRMRHYQNELVYREINTALDLNVLVLMILSAISFLLIQFFSIRQSASEFNILQSLGLAKTQIRALLIIEGLIYISIGLMLGIGIGIGLTYLIEPFFTQILPPVFNRFVFNQIVFNWPEIGRQYVFLYGLYCLGLLVILVSMIRNMRKSQIW